MDHGDREETRLSFSDLQFSSDDLQVDSNVIDSDLKQNSFSPSSSSSTNDVFLGFSSAEWSDEHSPSAPEDIIFCGKAIQTNSKTNQTSIYPKNSWKKKDEDNNKKNDDHHVLAQGRSKLACTSKIMWQVLMFGSGRFIPTKMELSGIRRRQLWRTSSRSMGEEEKTGGKRLSGLIKVLVCGAVEYSVMR